MNLLYRKLLKIPLLLYGLGQCPAESACTYLIYHSVSGRLGLELDLDCELFRRQLAFLAQTKRVISYEEAITRLQSAHPLPERAFVLTFDDGYVDFYTHVFPLLQQFQLPATLFVTTGFVEEDVPYPILNHRMTGVHPVNWEMLGEMAASKLVTLGAHTHTHPIMAQASKTRMEEELAKPIELFQKYLGMMPTHFAYPKAIWNADVEHLVAQHYRTAAVAGGHSATQKTFNPYRIPRLPIRRSDGWLFFLAKVRGWLDTEERLYAQLHRL